MSKETYGVHTPKLTTTTILRLMKECNKTIVDTSWGNDTCDSIMIQDDSCIHPDTGEYPHIFLPNSKNHDPDNGEWSTFCVSPKGYSDDYQLTFRSIDNLISYINDLTKYKLMAESIKEVIIRHANEIASNNPMYPDYDPEYPIDTLSDAITLLIHDNLPHDLDIEPDKLYDFLAEKLNNE